MIIDNCSTDGSYEYLKEEFPEYKVFRTDVNLGYTGGINFGFVKATEFDPDYILVLNNDTIVEKSFLTHLVNSMEKNSEAAGAGGLILAEHDRRTVWFGGGKLIPWRGLAVHFDKGLNKSEIKITSECPVTFLTGCMILFRAKALEKTGLEDDRFFMYLDDIELSSRIQRAGYSLVYNPESVIYHKVLGENKSPFKLYYSVRNRLLLINSMNSGVVKFIAKFYFITVILAKILLWSVTNSKFSKTARLALRDYFKGNLGKGNGLNLNQLTGHN